MKIFELEEYLDYLDHSDLKYFLEISHTNGSSLYDIIDIGKSNLISIHTTFVKDEIKIWMDLNGLKLTGKKIIVGHVHDKLDIYFESFELKN